MLLVAIVFIIFLLIGLPIAFVLGYAGLSHLISIGDPLFFSIIPQRLFSGINKFSLMAIPFFILTGEIMNKGRIIIVLVDLVREAIGYLRGGLSYASTIVAMFLSAILGSANAVSAILSGLLVPEMVKDGYEEGFSASLIASSSIVGPIIPPSVTFVVYGVLSGTSIGGLFLAGILPGIFLGASNMIISYYQSNKKGYPKYKERFEIKPFFTSLIKAFPALLIPLVITGGVMTGVFTPTESGAIAVSIALICGFIIYRTLNIKDIPGLFLRTALLSSGIMIIVALGNVLAWSMAIDNIPELIEKTILGISTNPQVVMLLVLIFLFFIGMVMEAFAVMVIFVPIFAPLAAQVGIDPIHFGLIFSVAISVALITPPVGMVLFVTSTVSGVPLSKLNKSIIPFAITSAIATIILAYIPKISLLIPDLFMK